MVVEKADFVPKIKTSYEDEERRKEIDRLLNQYKDQSNRIENLSQAISDFHAKDHRPDIDVYQIERLKESNGDLRKIILELSKSIGIDGEELVAQADQEISKREI